MTGAYMRPLQAVRRSDQDRAELPRLAMRRGSAMCPTVYDKTPADIHGGGLVPFGAGLPAGHRGFASSMRLTRAGSHVGLLDVSTLRRKAHERMPLQEGFPVGMWHPCGIRQQKGPSAVSD